MELFISYPGHLRAPRGVGVRQQLMPVQRQRCPSSSYFRIKRRAEPREGRGRGRVDGREPSALSSVDLPPLLQTPARSGLTHTTGHMEMQRKL